MERYAGVKQDMQELAQRLLIFGTHVHIGIEDTGISHRCHERGALPAATYALPDIQFAVLDGPQHRFEVLSQHHFPQLPP